jgi:UDPglucose--hexose-1-phosphate uridylyltransferase
MYDRITGYGAHEVVIESPDHEHTFADLSVEQVQEIIWAMRDRCIELQKDHSIRYVLIFKNWGREAGASQDHPHSQIIALPIVPKQVQEELAGAHKYYEYKERCCYCDMLQQDLKDGERVVVESDLFVSFMPFASRSPFETWIVPKEHSCFFDQIQKNQVQDLSRILKSTLQLLKRALDDPPYNFVIHTTPYDGTGNVPYYHWHIEITPKLTQTAGFEWGTGFFINPTPPEQAARYLREFAHRPLDQPSPVPVRSLSELH